MTNLLDHYVNDLRGKHFVVFGFDATWPRYLSPYGLQDHLASRGAVLNDEPSAQTNYVVFGNGRQKGKAKATRKVESLNQKGHSIEALTTHQFFHLLRPDIKGFNFAFTGGFSLGAADLEGGSEALLARYGGIVAPKLASETNILVVGERRGQGKTAALREVDELNKAGANIQILDEHAYLDLLAVMEEETSEEIDFLGFVVQLRNIADSKKTDRAIQMLKKESFKIYADVQDESVAGIIKSQSSSSRYYASWVQSDGAYCCYDNHLEECMGLQGKMCKHILVLLMGLSCNSDLRPQKALNWVTACSRKSPTETEDNSAQILLRYKGVEAGEIDWLPTETVPEDYYLL